MPEHRFALRPAAKARTTRLPCQKPPRRSRCGTWSLAICPACPAGRVKLARLLSLFAAAFGCWNRCWCAPTFGNLPIGCFVPLGWLEAIPDGAGQACSDQIARRNGQHKNTADPPWVVEPLTAQGPTRAVLANFDAVIREGLIQRAASSARLKAVSQSAP